MDKLPTPNFASLRITVDYTSNEFNYHYFDSKGRKVEPVAGWPEAESMSVGEFFFTSYVKHHPEFKATLDLLLRNGYEGSRNYSF